MTNEDLANKYRNAVAQLPSPPRGWTKCRQAICDAEINVAKYVADRGSAAGLPVRGIGKANHSLIEEIVRQNLASAINDKEPAKQREKPETKPKKIEKQLTDAEREALIKQQEADAAFIAKAVWQSKKGRNIIDRFNNPYYPKYAGELDDGDSYTPN